MIDFPRLRSTLSQGVFNMKFVFVFAAMTLGLPYAFAQMAETTDQVFEEEMGPMSNTDVFTLMSEVNLPNAPGHGDHGGGNGGGHGGDHGGPGDGHGGGHHNQISCYARDVRGNIYRASGPRWNWRRVQHRAVNKCERWSHFRCRALGCR
jgi:hypothetical protein